jgi:biopolymer transport protein ExbB/biopolymer transport protein TolQ
MEISFLELWQDIGWFARGIILLLILMSILSLGFAVQKWWRFRKSRKETQRFAPEFARFIQEEQLDAAIELAEKQKVSHVARVLGEALVEVKPLLRERATITTADINSAERAIERQMLILLAELKRGLGLLATVGATAPFVGLLGTVFGIVNSFTGMAVTGSGGLAAISAGIAEALFATGMGGSLVRHWYGPGRGDSGGVVLQLLPDKGRELHRGDDLYVQGAHRLLDQERRHGIWPFDLHQGVQGTAGCRDRSRREVAATRV